MTPTAPAWPSNWYQYDIGALPNRPRFKGTARADVAIIGGGYTGVAAALALAEAGRSFALFEAQRIGWGGSGRNGGQFSSGLNRDVATLRKLVGPGDAEMLARLSVEACQHLRQRVTQHSIDCDLTDGHITAAAKPSHIKDLQAELDAFSALGFDHGSLIEGDAVREEIDTGAYHALARDTLGGHLQPMRLALGLAAAAEAAGAKLYENSWVETIERHGDYWQVLTVEGAVSAPVVLVAADAQIGRLHQELGRMMLPVETFIMATAPLAAERAQRLMPRRPAVVDTRFALNYFRLTSDHRLLFGGDVRLYGFDPRDTPTALRRAMLKIFPQLQDVPAEHVWGGHVAITQNRLPAIGRTEEGVWYAAGYSGHGVSMAPFAGQVIADAIIGTQDRFDVLARIKHRPFPGGAALQKPLLALALLYARLRDVL